MSQQPFLHFQTDISNFIDELNHRIEKNKTAITELLAIQEKTYENFVRPFEMMDEYLDQFFTPPSSCASRILIWNAPPPIR